MVAADKSVSVAAFLQHTFASVQVRLKHPADISSI